MKRVLMIAALTAAISITLVGGAFAGTQDGSVFTLHAKAQGSLSKICTTSKPITACSTYLNTWPIETPAALYLVVAKVPDAVKGIAGASCGILYDNALLSGVDVDAWFLCADLEFTNGADTCAPDLPPCEWPISGGGNRITWVSTTNCQTTVRAPDGVHAVAGAFFVYAYSPDVFQLTPNLNLEIPELAVADCNASTTYLPMDGSATGSVGFGQPGCNPCIEYCGSTPVESTTWGRVKTQY